MEHLSHALRDRAFQVCEWIFDPDYHRESVVFRRERFLQALVIGSECLHEGLTRVLWPQYEHVRNPMLV